MNAPLRKALPAPSPRPPLSASVYARLKPLQRACSDPRKLREALAQGMDPNQHFDFNHVSRPLFAALQAFEPESVSLLLGAGADPNVDDGRGDALKWALSLAHNGDGAFACAQALAKAEHLAVDPRRPILGALGGLLGLAPLLTARGFDPNAQAPSQAIGQGLGAFSAAPSCLGMAVAFGAIDGQLHVRELLEVGADPNGGEASPLACAIVCGAKPLVVEELLLAGANPWGPTPAGGSCLAVARERASATPRSDGGRGVDIFNLLNAWAQRLELEAVAGLSPSKARSVL